MLVDFLNLEVETVLSKLLKVSIFKFLRCLIFLFFIISGFSLKSQSIFPQDSIKIYNLLNLGNAQLKKDHLDSASIFYLKAGDHARKVNFKRGITEYVFHYIKILNRQGKYQEALNLNLEAIEISKQLNDPHVLGMAYNNAGNNYTYMGNFNSAAEFFLNALKIAESLGDLNTQQKYSNNLASVFLSLQEKEKALIYCNQSYQLAIQNKDSLGMASTLVNLAVAEILNNRTGIASNHLNEVIKMGIALKDPSYVLDGYINLGDIEIKEKRFLGAKKYFEKALEILKTYPSPDYELYIHMGFAQCYNHLQLYDKSNVHLNKGIAVAESLGALDELRRLYLLGSEINENVMNAVLALDFRKKYQVLNDSINNSETKNNIHRIEIEYQTAQKEKALAEQELLIANNNIELQKQTVLIYLTFSIVLALFSAIIIFIIIHRNKQKANKEKLQFIQKQNELKILTAMVEGEEKERTRLAKELHDGVGGVLSAVKMHFSILKNENSLLKDPTKFEQGLSLLNYASQEIRAIAHNLSPYILLQYDLEKAILHFCESVKNNDLQVDCYILGDFPKFNKSFKQIIYRLVQELINNIIKHACASHAIVQLSYNENILSITVEDNGVGFKSDRLEGIGWINLKQRVNELHGQLTLNSEPGNGTSVYMEFETSLFVQNPPLEPVTQI